jgi:vesicle-fusing ATPase
VLSLEIDGVEQLNNILLIGMTNRKDMIDEALLRPGRLEVQMEIGLPDETGRFEILQIHTAKMREHKKLADNVNLDELAKITRNYSGAELEGLVRSATATAMNRIIKAKDRVEVDNDEADNLMVTSEDFEYAIEHDVKPAFGISEAELSSFVRNEIIHWNIETQVIISRGELVIQQTVESSRNHLVSMMIKGPAGSGKTALAVTIAQKSNFPFVKVISPENMIGYHESAKCQVIKKIFEDAYKSPVSCIVIDDIDSLLDYVSIGPRFSNVVLQALIVLLRKQPPARHRLLILGTTSLSNDTIKSLGIENAFNSSVNVPSVTKGTEVIKILQHLQFFEPQDLKVLEQKLKSAKLRIGIKHLIALSDAACQSKNPVSDFESILINEAGLHYPS